MASGSDDFSGSGALGAGYVTVPGGSESDWVRSGGVLNFNNAHSQSLLQRSDFTATGSYFVEVVEAPGVSPTTWQSGLCLSDSGGNNYALRRHVSGGMQFVRNEVDVGSVTNPQPTSYVPGTLRLQIAPSTGVVEALFNGTVIKTYTDSTPLAVNKAGLLGRSNDGAAGFDSMAWGDIVSAATAITLSGPSAGAVGAASTNFTVGANGSITGTVTVTPSAGGGGGTFSPTSVQISSGTPTATFTYTPASAGAKTISVTNSASLTNPSSITYTASAPGGGRRRISALIAALFLPMHLTSGGSSSSAPPPVSGTYGRPTSEMPTDWRPFARLATGGNTAATFTCLDDAIRDAVSPCTILVDPTYILTPDAEINQTYGAEGPIGSFYLRNYGTQLAGFTLQSSVVGTPVVVNLAARSQASAMAGYGGVTGVTLGAASRNVLIQDIHFTGWRGTDSPSNCGVKIDCGYAVDPPPACTVKLVRVRLQDWTNGVLTTQNPNLDIEYEDSLTQDCSGGGLSHGLYASHIGNVKARGSAWIFTVAMRNGGSVDPQAGHLFKARPFSVDVQGCYFSSGYGGARIFDISNGGTFLLRDSILIKRTADAWAHENMMLGFGAEQRPYYQPPDHTVPYDTERYTYTYDGRSHSVTIERCTIIKEQATFDSLVMEMVKIWPDMCNDDGSPAVVATSIRNNIVSGLAAAGFVSAYPNNSEVPLSSVDMTTGAYSGTPIPCNPADTAGNMAFRGYFLPVLPRTDDFRGGLPVSDVAQQAWMQAQSTPNHWYDIPGTVWLETMKADGTGVDGTGRAVPAFNPIVYGFTGYDQVFANGGPCWSIKNKEWWNNGGGHVATDNNITVKVRVGRASPDIVIASSATPYATRYADFHRSDTYSMLAHSAAAGVSRKPFAAHNYRQTTYSDLLDEFVVMSQPNLGADGYDAYHQSIGVWGTAQQMSMPRTADESLGGDGNWRPLSYWPNNPFAGPNNEITPAAVTAENLAVYSRDGRYAYCTFGNGGPLMRQDLVSKVWTQVTPAGVDWSVPGFGTLATTPNGDQVLIWISNAQAGWFIRRINLATGAQSAVAVSGVAGPSSPGGNMGMEYVDHLGVYVTYHVTASGCYFIKHTPTNADHTAFTASAVVTTGSPPVDVNFRRHIAYDPDWQRLMVTDGPSRPWKHLLLA